MNTSTSCWYTLLLLFAGVFYAVAQAPVKEWDLRFGGNSSDKLKIIVPSSDEGYLLAGTSLSDSSGDKSQPNWGSGWANDYWVIKIDGSGNKQWDAHYGGNKPDVLFDAIATADHGYLLAGTTFSGNTGDKTQPLIGICDFWIIKIDSNGVKQWDKNFGGSESEFLNSVAQTPDGGYLLGGFTNSGISGDISQPSRGDNDYWIVKTDALGNKQWDKRFGSDHGDELFKVIALENGYLLAGRSIGGISGDRTVQSKAQYDFWLVKINATGEKLWDVAFGTFGSDYPSVCEKTYDGGFVLGGNTTSGVSGDKGIPSWGGDDMWILKIDSNANKLWDTGLGGISADYPFTICLTTDSGFLVLGKSQSGVGGNKTTASKGNDDYCAFKINSEGVKLWDILFGTSNHDSGLSSVQTPDNGYLVGGISDGGADGDRSQPCWGSSDFWIIKTTPDLSTGTATIDNYLPALKIFPNPTASSTAIEFSLDATSLAELSLLDLQGRKIKTLAEGNFEAGTHEMILHKENLQAGVYFIKFLTASRIQTSKLIIQ